MDNVIKEVLMNARAMAERESERINQWLGTEIAQRTEIQKRIDQYESLLAREQEKIDAIDQELADRAGE